MRYFLQLLVLAVVLSGTNSLKIQCTPTQMSDYSSYISGSIKTCKVEHSLNIQQPNQFITSVDQEVTPADYEGLVIEHKTIHYIPKGLGKFFKRLKVLKIYNSGLKIVEANDFENLTNLTVLNLYYNVLQVLESDLLKFTPGLIYVNFESNSLKFIGADIFKDLLSLREGRFYSNPCISAAESGITGIARLESAFREGCALPEIIQKRYEQIESLKAALKTFEVKNYGNCDGNLNTATKLLHQLQQQCSQLDDGRSDFILTTVVKLSSGKEPWSKVKIVSEHTKISIATLGDRNETIRQISIDHQQTFYLPTNFGELFPQLEELSVTYSGLYEIDEIVFENMKNLETLNLTGNKLQEVLVPTFDELEKLKVLDLSFNNLASLEPAIFEKLKNLVTIKLNDNSLEALDGNYFEHSRDLEAVHLNNNKLKFISANLFSSLKNLLLVNLENNVCIGLKHPNDALAEIEAKIIDNCIAPIRFHCKEALAEKNVSTKCSAKLAIDFPKAKVLNFLNSTLTDVKVFHVIDQVMKFLPLELSKVFTNLSEVSVVNSSLIALQQSDFKEFDHLKIIRITLNNISSIEEGTFTGVPALEYLNLSQNNILVLPSKVFSKLRKMKFLILAGNKLKKLAADFLPKKNQIQDLMLQDNELELIETKTLRLVRKARVIDFSLNECIDLRYEKASNSSRSMVEISGEIDLNCSGDSSDESDCN